MIKSPIKSTGDSHAHPWMRAREFPASTVDGGVITIRLESDMFDAQQEKSRTSNPVGGAQLRAFLELMFDHLAGSV